MARLHAQPGRPLCIVLADGTRLAVPPMPRGLPGPVRVRVFEYVLRRQLGLAEAIVQIEEESLRHRERHLAHDLAVAVSVAADAAVAA